jgi:hypothetical protein
MTDHRRTHRGAVAPRRPRHHTNTSTTEGSTHVQTQHGIVARAVHDDRIREHQHPTRRTWFESGSTRRTRTSIRARVGRSIVRFGERVAADPVLTPAGSR